ncbi:MAG TPA: CBS domain-containing protein [Pseudonocardiaceae bacterium]|jgi:CBS domain-containing protein|nr:CBS domain-containing protein [Pseudonocardiaceae bacterium]
MRITDVLRHKGSDVATIAPTAQVGELVTLLDERNIGAVVVTENGSGDGPVAGIVSERDIVRRLHSRGTGLLTATVGEIMTTTVFSCAPADTVDSLAETMTQRRIRHVPVLEDDRLVGIVSIGDVVKSRISQLEDDREQLASYISQG